MKLVLLAAVAHQRVIGNHNTLPWHLPDDLRRFRRLTLGKTVIMGRKTFESLPGPLTGRHSVITSRNQDFSVPAADVEVASSLDDALSRARSSEVFIIGGASLYAQTLPRAHRLYLTEIDATVEGDAFFPSYDPAAWTVVAKETHAPDERHRYAFNYLTLDRRA